MLRHEEHLVLRMSCRCGGRVISDDGPTIPQVATFWMQIDGRVGFTRAKRSQTPEGLAGFDRSFWSNAGARLVSSTGVEELVDGADEVGG
jgi:hypothetical protein